MRWRLSPFSSAALMRTLALDSSHSSDSSGSSTGNGHEVPERDRRLMPAPPLPQSSSRSRIAGSASQRALAASSSRHSHGVSQSQESNRSRPGPSSSLVAPSLPGYGPPRTTSDAPRVADSRSGSETETDEGSDGGASNTRRTARSGRYGASSSGSGMISNREQQQFLQRQQQQQIQHQLVQQHQQLLHQHQQQQHYQQSLQPRASAPPSVQGISPSAYPSMPHRVLSPAAPFPGQQAFAYSDSVAPVATRVPTPLQRTQSAQAQSLDLALDRLQTSLSALHERLSSLETQSRLTAGALAASSSNSSPLLQLLRLTFSSLLSWLSVRPATSSRTQASVKLLVQQVIRQALNGIKRVMGDLTVVLLLATVVTRTLGGGVGSGGIFGSVQLIQQVLQRVAGGREGQAVKVAAV